MMSKNKLCKTIASILLAAVIIAVSVSTAFAAQTAQHSLQYAQYTNPETGYQVIISDDIDLLTDEEENRLVEDMAGITEYGHVIFWTTDTYTSDEIDQARQARRSLYEFDSACIFAINMNVRKLTIQSYGTIYESVTDSKARSITDNVSSLATSKKYYQCANEAFSQVYSTVQGKQIAEPMKYISYAVIALMLGVIIALSVAFSKKFNPLRKPAAPARTIGSGALIAGGVNPRLVRTETVIIESSSGGGGGGGCGGGGGGCGGGGSSSF